jgi:MinD-like ATPase involved in chromosome partitioning or flagellar assembly
MSAWNRFPRPGGSTRSWSGFRRVELVGRGRWRAPHAANLPGRIIAVGAAGGAVGKSTIAANLAVAMANLGAQVVIVDLDLGSPSLHTLFGVERPVAGVRALLGGEIHSLEVSLTRTAVRNLQLVAGGGSSGGGGGGGGAIDQSRASPPPSLDRQQKQLLMARLGQLDADVIVVDVGSGNRGDLLDYFATGALRLLVTSPVPSSLRATYAFLEGAARRAGRCFGGGADDALRAFGGRLVGNLARSPEEAETLHAFSRLAASFLKISMPVIGCVRASDRIARSVADGRPLLLGGGVDENVDAFHLMAEALLKEDATAASACDLGEPDGLPDGGGELPESLELHRRRYPRHEVDWIGTLRTGDRDVAVRVMDISIGGAALEVVSALELGQPATLFFDQLPGRPGAPVIVKSLRTAIRRAGVAFAGADALSRELVAAAESARSLTDRRSTPLAR